MKTRDDLKQWLAAAPRRLPDGDRAVYDSPHHAVSVAGRWYTLGGLEPRYGRGSPGYCFLNAWQAVSRQRELRYVEGFAIAEDGQPLHHAWVADQTGQAWDVTWPWRIPANQVVLCGVQVPRPALMAHWRACGAASFLADDVHGYPALRVAYKQWSRILAPSLEVVRETHCRREVAEGRARELPDGSIQHVEHIGPAIAVTIGPWRGGLHR